MKKLILLIVCVLMTHLADAQQGKNKSSSKIQKRIEKNNRITQLIRQAEEGINIYEKQFAIGFKLNTDGFSAFFEKGKMKTIRQSSLYSIELGERKHPKEIKVVPTALGTLPNKYVYGKINNFYYAKVAYAHQYVVGNKGNKNGVEITALYGAGIIAGLMKPYYIKVGTSRIIEDVKYNNNDDVFLNNPQQIYGATGFSKGIGETKITPGASIKTAFRFDYGRYNRMLNALEVGLNAEIYTKQMQQMLLVKKDQFFFNAYAAIMFGKRK